MIRNYLMGAVVAAISAVLLTGTGIVTAEEKSEKKEKQVKKEKQEKQEEEYGFRKGSLFEEEAVKPVHGEYVSTEPGKSKKFQRAFENSPPLIPHDLTGMLPIAQTNN
ncbi:MAG TPA: nitrate reductase cytochrome c-type subunit, partial [Dissulfurispiraceae bacterium]|nr:nitrate reductase cytochrome c-type subunit [Dissulfurispiraceae bacterium]